MTTPWLVWTWDEEGDGSDLILCLRCGWCASPRLPLPVQAFAALVESLQAEHAECNTPPLNTTGT